MPSSYSYFKEPKTSKRLVWRVLFTFLFVTLAAFVYFQFFSNGDGFYDKAYYEKISGIRIPRRSTVLEAYDNGEFWTAASFKIDSDSLHPFITSFNFRRQDTGNYRPVMFGESFFKIETLQATSRNYLFTTGTKGKNNWVYIVDTARGILWAEIQYPDWAGH